MNDKVMQAFWEGLAQLTGAFFRTAAKQGFSIILLVIVCGGFVAWVDKLNRRIREMQLEQKIELAEVRNEYRGDIARLRITVDSLRNGLDDCNEARIKAESERAVLLQLLKKKR